MKYCGCCTGCTYLEYAHSGRSDHGPIGATSCRLLRLPDHLQCKLNIAGLWGQTGHFSAGDWRSGLVEESGAVDWLRRSKVGVVEDVEDLGTKLNIKRFGNSCNREVLGCRDVNVTERWPTVWVAARVATEIRAIL